MLTTQWVIGVATLVAGAVLAGFATLGMGLDLLWSGALDTRADSGRPWWLWLLFPAPPVLMAVAALVVRRAGASVPVTLAAAGAVGVLVGIGYLAIVYLTGR